MECETIIHYDFKTGIPLMKPKKKFNTLEEAIICAKHVNSKPHIIHKVVAYKCYKCFKFHVGRNGKELKAKDRIKFKNYLKEKSC
jgi:hypothetical protein